MDKCNAESTMVRQISKTCAYDTVSYVMYTSVRKSGNAAQFCPFPIYKNLASLASDSPIKWHLISYRSVLLFQSQKLMQIALTTKQTDVHSGTSKIESQHVQPVYFDNSFFSALAAGRIVKKKKFRRYIDRAVGGFYVRLPQSSQSVLPQSGFLYPSPSRLLFYKSLR